MKDIINTTNRGSQAGFFRRMRALALFNSVCAGWHTPMSVEQIRSSREIMD